MQNYRRIVVKVGSNVLTTDQGHPDEARLQHLIEQISELRRNRLEVILVTSGAVASGRSLVPFEERTDPVIRRQVLAAVGQVRLMNLYSESCRANDLLCAQILVTKEDFRSRRHYLNMRNCFSALLEQAILPIANENDAISVTELMFTDNDELAGLIASMMDADAVFLMTNVDGIFNGDPSSPGSQLIPRIDHTPSHLDSFLSPSISQLGRGGMKTKCRMALRLARMGMAVHIVNGKRDHILTDLMRGQSLGTVFPPRDNASPIKRWIAHSEGFSKGTAYINEGAYQALCTPKYAASLLPVGITRLEGNFQRGDVIRICNESGLLIGVGVTQYGSAKAQSLLGKKNQKPLVHYDYLFLNHE